MSASNWKLYLRVNHPDHYRDYLEQCSSVGSDFLQGKLDASWAQFASKILLGEEARPPRLKKVNVKAEAELASV